MLSVVSLVSPFADQSAGWLIGACLLVTDTSCQDGDGRLLGCNLCFFCITPARVRMVRVLPDGDNGRAADGEALASQASQLPLLQQLYPDPNQLSLMRQLSSQSSQLPPSWQQNPETGQLPPLQQLSLQARQPSPLRQKSSPEGQLAAVRQAPSQGAPHLPTPLRQQSSPEGELAASRQAPSQSAYLSHQPPPLRQKSSPEGELAALRQLPPQGTHLPHLPPPLRQKSSQEGALTALRQAPSQGSHLSQLLPPQRQKSSPEGELAALRQPLPHGTHLPHLPTPQRQKSSPEGALAALRQPPSQGAHLPHLPTPQRQKSSPEDELAALRQPPPYGTHLPHAVSLPNGGQGQQAGLSRAPHGALHDALLHQLSPAAQAAYRHARNLRDPLSGAPAPGSGPLPSGRLLDDEHLLHEGRQATTVNMGAGHRNPLRTQAEAAGAGSSALARSATGGLPSHRSRLDVSAGAPSGGGRAPEPGVFQGGLHPHLEQETTASARTVPRRPADSPHKGALSAVQDQRERGTVELGSGGQFGVQRVPASWIPYQDDGRAVGALGSPRNQQDGTQRNAGQNSGPARHRIDGPSSSVPVNDQNPPEFSRTAVDAPGRVHQNQVASQAYVQRPAAALDGSHVGAGGPSKPPGVRFGTQSVMEDRYLGATASASVGISGRNIGQPLPRGAQWSSSSPTVVPSARGFSGTEEMGIQRTSGLQSTRSLSPNQWHSGSPRASPEGPAVPRDLYRAQPAAPSEWRGNRGLGSPRET